MTVGEWMVTLLILWLPLVNIIIEHSSQKEGRKPVGQTCGFAATSSRTSPTCFRPSFANQYVSSGALDNNGNPNRRNFCRASLLWFAMMMGIAVDIGVVMAILGAAFGAVQTGRNHRRVSGGKRHATANAGLISSRREFSFAGHGIGQRHQDHDPLGVRTTPGRPRLNPPVRGVFVLELNHG